MIDPFTALTAALVDDRVWVALATSCLAALILVSIGVLVASRTGLLDGEAGGYETFSVGLSVGLLTFAATWASIASLGASGLVPAAVTTVFATLAGDGRLDLRLLRQLRSVPGAVGVVSFLVAAGLLYGATLAPSPSGGYQPTEFFDTAYYAVLGADLSSGGRESLHTPSGFEEFEGQPTQVWYHWGELWLAAATIDLTGMSPMHARHLVVLPLLLLAAASMTGTLVRRLVSRSTESSLLAASAMLFLAPIPLSLDVYFAGRARGLVFTITQYGLVAIVILLGVYVFATRRPTLTRWAGALMAAALAAALIATHIGLAIVVLAALGATFVVGAARSRGARRTSFRAVRPWWKLILSVAGATLATIVWGVATGHGLGALDPMAGIHPFDPIWQVSVLLTTLGGGVLLAAPLGWYAIRRRHPDTATLAVFGSCAVAAGAVGWGIRVSDLNSFHLFFGAIATALTPISIIVVLIALHHLRGQGRTKGALALLTLMVVQTSISALLVVVQLQRFGPGRFPPISTATLATIREMATGSKMAYACEPLENVAPWDASLIAIDAHTGARMVPMCFMADVQRDLLERPLDPTIESPYFRHAPQRALYPTADARPATVDVRRFLAVNGIDYIYADAAHPNRLVPDAEPIYARDDVTLYRVSPG